MLFSLLVGASLFAAVPDSLEAATVVADRGLVISRTDTLRVSPSGDITSTLNLLPGLYVGDYGSLAGLKSVSLRGFGSAHTALFIDGVRVKNIQSGQADLGMLDLASTGAVVADYAQNSLSFMTARPVFGDAPVSGEVRLSYGSFGTWLPYGRLNGRLTDRWSLSASVGGTLTRGNFPLQDGTLRTNNDLKQLRTGVDLFGLLEEGDFHAKVYYNGADRGTPGSLSWPSADRQQDRNVLGQFLLRKHFGPVYTLHLSGKTAFDKLFYQSEWGNTDYRQTEFQLSSAHKFRVKPWWELSLATDLSLAGLASTLYTENRLETVVAAASAFRFSRLKANLAVEYAGVFDSNGAAWNSVSPSADLRLTLAEGLDLVAFGRRAFRTPTFNELYYPGYGNPDLKPEDAWLTDLGVDFQRKAGAWTPKLRVDGYYNWLANKIVSAPTVADPNIWLPFNVGKVQAFGADVLAGTDYARGSWTASLTARYGFQKALDKTPDSYTFDQQIPYVARHTLSVDGRLGWNGWQLGAVWNLRSGRRDAAGEMPDWNALDVSLSKDFTLGGVGLGLYAHVRNVLDCRYEIVSGYPVPGRNFMGGIRLSF